MQNSTLHIFQDKHLQEAYKKLQEIDYTSPENDCSKCKDYM